MSAYEYVPDGTYEKLKSLGRKSSSLIDNADLEFHLRDSIADAPVTGIKCAICNSVQFNIGQGEYCLVIRCPTCGWETAMQL